MEHVDALRIEVVYSPGERRVERVPLQLGPGATVLHAVRESRLLERYPDISLGERNIGIWGRAVGLSQRLREGDRVEIYRSLKVDPKEARRQRYRGQQQSRKG